MPEYRPLTSLSQIAAAIEAGETLEYKFLNGTHWSKYNDLDSIYTLDSFEFRVFLPAPKLIEKTMYKGIYSTDADKYFTSSDYLWLSIDDLMSSGRYIGYTEVICLMKETP